MMPFVVVRGAVFIGPPGNYHDSKSAGKQGSFFLFLIKKKNFFKYIFLRERQRRNMSRGRAEREGDTESEADSRLRAVSTEPDAGLNLTNREITT